jgi:hypothetical protein
MYQTAYNELLSIGRTRAPYVGGFCRWWYTPIQNIALFPVVDPVTQLALGAPTLLPDTTWYGPVNVPDGQLGWDEDLQQAKPGHYYKEKVYGVVPGMDAASHNNFQNLAFHHVVVVGKARSGGNFYLIGSDHSGLDFTFNTSTGVGWAGMPGTKITLTGESIDKALILPAFSPGSLPPSGSSGNTTPGPSTQPDMETISFNNVSTVVVPYNTSRRNRFGDFPTIEIWLLDPDTLSYYKSTSAEILVDQPPPNETTFTVKPGNGSTGFIILSN